MKLKALRVENFKSIYDSGRFELDNVTCLVGKNEAGKTALLQSLYKLNPAIPSDTDFVPIMEYPRRKWMEYQAHYQTDGHERNLPADLKVHPYTDRSRSKQYPACPWATLQVARRVYPGQCPGS